MIQRSWFYRNGLYYTILALVILLHLILLATRMYHDWRLTDSKDSVQPRQERTFKIKFQPDAKRQIVQSEDPLTKEKPTKKSYLSDKDRKFDRESVARKVDTFKSSGGGNSNKDSLSLSDLGAFEKGHNPLKAAAKTAASKRQVAGQKRNNNQTGVSSTNDYVEDVPLGDLTYLNTVEYKYYGFFHRIRQKLEQFWGRSIHEKAEAIMKEGRRVASNDNLITALVVTLNEAGEIVNIVIKGSSGVKELDDSAVESFNEAGPFPNPPKELVENGEVKIEWGFVINT
jgi:protein TonB